MGPIDFSLSLRNQVPYFTAARKKCRQAFTVWPPSFPYFIQWRMLDILWDSTAHMQDTSFPLVILQWKRPHRRAEVSCPNCLSPSPPTHLPGLFSIHSHCQSVLTSTHTLNHTSIKGKVNEMLQNHSKFPLLIASKDGIFKT